MKKLVLISLCLGWSILSLSSEFDISETAKGATPIDAKAVAESIKGLVASNQTNFCAIELTETELGPYNLALKTTGAITFAEQSFSFSTGGYQLGNIIRIENSADSENVSRKILTIQKDQLTNDGSNIISSIKVAKEKFVDGKWQEQGLETTYCVTYFTEAPAEN